MLARPIYPHVTYMWESMKENTYKSNPCKQNVPKETITDVVSAICRHFKIVFNNRLPLAKHIYEL
jgi:hypothetical protein